MNRKLGRPFTFNELIIVLSAAMLLGVLLLPAHHLLRPLKENAACSANLKQLTVNAMNYAADNNNMMIEYRPSTTKDVGKDNWVWNMVRQGYIQPKHLFCETITQYTKYSLSQPAYAAELEAMDNFARGNAWKYKFISYGYNWNIGGVNYWGDYTGSAKCSEIRQPEHKVLFADAFTKEQGGAGFLGIDMRYNVWAKIHERHAGGANIAWADGHVSFMNQPVKELQNHHTSFADATNHIRYYFYRDYSGGKQ